MTKLMPKAVLLRLVFVLFIWFGIFSGYIVAQKYAQSIVAGGLISAIVTMVISSAYLIIVRLLGVKSKW